MSQTIAQEVCVWCLTLFCNTCEALGVLSQSILELVLSSATVIVNPLKGRDVNWLHLAIEV